MDAVVRRETTASTEDSSVDDTTGSCYESDVRLSVAPTQDQTISLVQKEAPAPMALENTRWWKEAMDGLSRPFVEVFKMNTPAGSKRVATSGYVTMVEESRHESMAEPAGRFEHAVSRGLEQREPHLGQARPTTNADDDLPAIGTSGRGNPEAEGCDVLYAGPADGWDVLYAGPPAMPKRCTRMFRGKKAKCDRLTTWLADRWRSSLVSRRSRHGNAEACDCDDVLYTIQIDDCDEPYAGPATPKRCTRMFRGIKAKCDRLTAWLADKWRSSLVSRRSRHGNPDRGEPYAEPDESNWHANWFHYRLTVCTSLAVWLINGIRSLVVTCNRRRRGHPEADGRGEPDV